VESASELEVSGFVLNQEQAGESHRRVYLFHENGLSAYLFRHMRSGPFARLPDFLDEVECLLNPPKAGTGLLFVREFKVLSSQRELAKNAESFLVASQLARFYLDNGAHLLDPALHLCLLKKGMDAIPRAVNPSLVLLKVYFEFSRNEGLPVRESWLQSLEKEGRTHAEALLSRPVHEFTVAADELIGLLTSLKIWMNEETELRV
jgi:hypothetical protein